MRLPCRAACLRGFLVAGALALFVAGAAHAATLTWAASGFAPPTGGTGVWNLATSDWSSTGSSILPWVNGDIAEFGATAGTVTLASDGLIADGLQFDTSGYTINGNGHTLTLAGAGAFINANNTLINAPLGGGAIVSVTGGLTLGDGGMLGQLNVVSGATFLNGGTLNLTNSTFPLTVGSATTAGQFTIQNGAIVNAPGNTVRVDGLTGTNMTVSGAGSQLNAGGPLVIGDFSSGGGGSLTVQTGGSVTVNQGLNVATPNSAVTVNGGSLAAGSILGISGSAINLQADPTGGAALTLSGTQAGNDSGVITGAGSVVKNGAAAQTLSGANTFTGGTTINGGSLVLGNALALQNSTVAINVDNGLNLNGLATATLGGLTGSGALSLGTTALTVGGDNASTTYSGVLSGATVTTNTAGGSLTKTGAGTLTLTGGGSYDDLAVSQGVLSLAGGTTNLNDPPAALFVTGGGSLLVSSGAVLNGNGGVIDGASGPSLTIDGAGSTVNIGSQLSIGNGIGGSVTVQNGGSLAAANGLIFVGMSGPGSLTAQSGGTITSSAGLVGYGGSATATITGANSRWDTQTLAIGLLGTGTLNVSNGGTVNAAQYINVASPPDTTAINVNGGSVVTGALYGVGTIDLQADPTVGAALTIIGEQSGSYSGIISGAGSLVKSGAAAQTLSGANTFTGGTTITGGSLVLGNALALQNSTVALNVDNGLNLNGLATATLGGLAGNGALSLGTTALTVGGNNAGTTYSGVLSGATGGSLTKTGAGTLTLTGGGSYDSLTVSQGVLALAGGTTTLTNPGTALSVIGGAALVAGGAILNTDFGLINGGAGTSLTVDGAGSQLNAANQITIGAGNTGSVTVQNGGSLAANNAFIYVGANGGAGSLTVQSGGTVNSFVGYIGAGSTGTATVTGADSSWNTTYLGMGTGGGVGTLTVSNGGTFTASQHIDFLSPASTSSIIVNGGSVVTGALLNGGTINLQADPTGGAALTITGAESQTYSGVITGTGSVTKTGAGTQILTGANTYTGLTTVNGGLLEQQGGANYSQITVGNGGTFVAGNGAVLAPGLAFGTITSSGVVSYQNATVFGGFLAGSGVHNANGATFNGTTVDAGATLTFSGATALNNVTDNGLIVTSPSLVTWNGGQVGASGELDVNNQINVSGITNNGVIRVGTGGALDSTGQNLVLAAGSRAYVGTAAAPAGTINLTGGTLELNGGLLDNNGTINGTVDVNFGGLAEGAGTYGAVNVSQGGAFHPGNSPGTATTDSATWGAGGAYDFDILTASGTPGINWSLWDIRNALDITAGTTPNSQFTIDITSVTAGDSAGPLPDFNPNDNYQWVIASAASVNGFNPADFALNSSNFANALDGGRFSLVESGTNIDLDFTAEASPSAPEPGTMGMMLAALGLAAMFLRRRAGFKI